MGIEKTKTDFRGILIPDPRLTIANFSAADSTITEANPKPGVPVPATVSDLVLSATGSQSASSSIDLQALRGGHPIEGGGGYVWKASADSVTSWRGWDVPSVATGWESLVWTDGTGVTSGPRATHEPHAITLGDGQILLAFREQYYTLGPPSFTTYHVRVKRRATDGTWTQSTVFTADYTPSGFDPCLLLLPSGRVLCFHWFEDADLDQAQIRMHFSDDKGASWTVGQELILDTPIDISAGASGHVLGRIRAEIISGEILMVAELVSNNAAPSYREGFVQLASDDLGATFRQVFKTTGTTGGGRFSILNVGGVFHAYFVNIATAELGRYRVGSAFQSFETTTVEDLIGSLAGQTDSEVWGLLDGTSKFFANVDCSAWLDENGILYVAGRQPSVNSDAIVIRSTDRGSSWAGLGQSSATHGYSKWVDFYDSATYVRDFSMTAQGGRAVAFHNWTAAPGNEDDSLAAIYLGGWSQVTMPTYKTFSRDVSRVGWDRTYFPWDLPDAVGWGLVSSGGNTASLIGGALQIGTTTGQRVYTITPPGTVDEGLLVRASVSVSGSAAPGHEVVLRGTLADGGQGFRMRATFRDTQILLFDMYDGGGTSIGSLSIDCTAGVQILLGMEDGKVSVWARLDSTSDDRQWTNIVSDQALVDNGGGGSSEVRFGNGPASIATSNWKEVHFVSDEYAGQGLAEGQSNPDEVFPRAFSTSPAWVNSGVYVAAKDGPAFRGEEWTIQSRAEFPVSNVLPAVSPSPRERWRSVGTGQARLAFRFAEDGAMSSVMGLYLEGVNFRTGSIEGWDGAAWQTITTFDTATELSGLPYIRDGATIKPGLTGHTAQRYIGFDELDGATVDLGSSKFRKISRNTPGLWSDTAILTVTKPVQAHLETVDGTEPASGTANIWSRRLLVTIRAAANFTGYRLVIDSQSNADGYFEIGSAVLGPVFLFSRDYSWGRVLALDTNTELTQARDGTRRSRVLGPSRRKVEFGWIDGIDMTPILGANPDPAYLKATSTVASKPAALDGETPLLIRDLVGHLNGQHTPCVYLANVAKGTPDVQQTTAQDAAIYGRIMTGVRLETVQGEELEDEVTRIATITIEQEL